MSIGQTIRGLREQRGYSQQQAADGMSLNIVKYRTLEEDIATITLELVLSAADFYEISLDELLQRNSQTVAGEVSDLNRTLRENPFYDGVRLSAAEVGELEEWLGRVAERTRKLRHIAGLLHEEPELLKRLQQLKIVNAKLDSASIVDAIERALA